MKYLLVLLVIVLAIGIWRHNRREERLDAQQKNRRAAPPTPHPSSLRPPDDMITCHHCGLHLPATEAVAGRQGRYCSAEHRQHAEA